MYLPVSDVQQSLAERLRIKMYNWKRQRTSNEHVLNAEFTNKSNEHVLNAKFTNASCVSSLTAHVGRAVPWELFKSFGMKEL